MTDATEPTRKVIATIDRAYRVATSMANATERDVHIIATAAADRPFVVDHDRHPGQDVIATIVTR